LLAPPQVPACCAARHEKSGCYQRSAAVEGAMPNALLMAMGLMATGTAEATRFSHEDRLEAEEGEEAMRPSVTAAVWGCSAVAESRMESWERLPPAQGEG